MVGSNISACNWLETLLTVPALSFHARMLSGGRVEGNGIVMHMFYFT